MTSMENDYIGHYSLVILYRMMSRQLLVSTQTTTWDSDKFRGFGNAINEFCLPV